MSCPPDSVVVGTTCVDTYEASVWQIVPSNTALIQKVQAGTATLADLTGGGATQLSAAEVFSPGYPTNFPNDGNWTPVLGSSPPSPGVYAVSIPGVLPSTNITWFQAVQACAVSGKRLIRNGEWQRAAAGTPDPGSDNFTTDCNVGYPSSSAPSKTGSRTNCKSSWGVFDMVGNAGEWVEDWADGAGGCTDWTSQTGIAGGDASCFGGPGTTSNGGETSPFNSIPAALWRGGDFDEGPLAGVFAVSASFHPSGLGFEIGFRCAR
jgi:formylglycine-generating enzyme required for sulfatase activity